MKDKDKYHKNISAFPLLLVNFIGTLGFSIVIPFFVVLVTKFGGNAFLYGILTATYSLFQLIGSPILGRWSDRYGRKKILLLSQAGTALAWVIFLIALYLPITTILTVDSPLVGSFLITLPIVVLFLARALDGLTGGNVSVANAYLADISTEKNRSSNFGKMSVSANLGFIIGPALAGILASTVLEEALPVIATLIISVIALPIIIFYLPESKVVKKDSSTPEPTTKEKRACLNINHVPYMIILYFLIFLAFNIFYTAFPIHALQGLGWSIGAMGIYFSVLSGIMVLVQGPLLSALSKKLSDSTLAIFGSLVLGSSFLVMLFSDVIILYLAAALFALGNGLMWPSILAILSRIAGNEQQGAVQGIAGSAGAFASIIGLIIGGILYGIFQEITFVISAIIIYAVFFLTFRLKEFKSPAS